LGTAAEMAARGGDFLVVVFKIWSGKRVGNISDLLQLEGG